MAIIDKITIKNPNSGSSTDYDIGAASLNIKYKSTSVYDELNTLNTNKVDKHQTGGYEDRLMTKAEADKLADLQNVQPDWNQSDNTQKDYIKNKPKVATLDENNKVPIEQLPSYVDDVIEYASIEAFPVTGENGKIYVAIDTNKTYRWSGTIYVEISESLALGETSSTAFAGNRGKAIEDKIPSNASASNKFATIADIPIISYPVSSVNSKTGTVILTASDIGAISTSDKGIVNGVATLDSNGKISSSQIPSTLTGGTIHKAEFEMERYSSDESGIKAMILALGDFLGEIEYSLDPSIPHKYLSKKAQIMHIELSDPMYNYDNHNNSDVYWFQPSNTSYTPYVNEPRFTLTYGKYIHDVPTDYSIDAKYSEYTFTMPMENFYGSTQFAYPLRATLNLPGIEVRTNNGNVNNTVINYIYNYVKFIRFKDYMCSSTGSNEYINVTTGNYIEYKDFVSNIPMQIITVYYFDI